MRQVEIFSIVGGGNKHTRPRALSERRRAFETHTRKRPLSPPFAGSHEAALLIQRIQYTYLNEST